MFLFCAHLHYYYEVYVASHSCTFVRFATTFLLLINHSFFSVENCYHKKCDARE
jgi:hypothetical protein